MMRWAGIGECFVPSSGGIHGNTAQSHRRVVGMTVPVTVADEERRGSAHDFSPDPARDERDALQRSSSSRIDQLLVLDPRVRHATAG